MPVSEAIIAVTSRCNAKCAMCGLWQEEKKTEVEPSFYYNLPKSLTNVNITGGEPFLRKDLLQILSVVSDRCRKVRPVISTNGLLTDRILESVPQFLKINPRTAVRVSIDGIGKTHDEIRGVKAGYDRALTTLKELIDQGVKDLGIGFTLMRANENEMMDVYELSRELKIQFTATIAHSSPIFFGDQKDQSPDPQKAADAFARLKTNQLNSLHPKDWFRAYFTDGLIDLLKASKRRIECPALSSFFFMNPQGVVFPCHILDEPVGQLDQAPYERLIENVSDGPEKYRHCEKQCWMTCTVAPEMKKHPWGVAAWIAKEKLSNFLNTAKP